MLATHRPALRVELPSMTAPVQPLSIAHARADGGRVLVLRGDVDRRQRARHDRRVHARGPRRGGDRGRPDRRAARPTPARWRCSSTPSAGCAAAATRPPSRARAGRCAPRSSTPRSRGGSRCSTTRRSSTRRASQPDDRALIPAVVGGHRQRIATPVRRGALLAEATLAMEQRHPDPDLALDDVARAIADIEPPAPARVLRARGRRVPRGPRRDAHAARRRPAADDRPARRRGRAARRLPPGGPVRQGVPAAPRRVAERPPPRAARGERLPPAWRSSTSPAIATRTPTRSRRRSATPSCKGRLDPRNEYVPVRLGDLNAQTRWVLDRSGAPEPELLRARAAARPRRDAGRLPDRRATATRSARSASRWPARTSSSCRSSTTTARSPAS